MVEVVGGLCESGALPVDCLALLGDQLSALSAVAIEQASDHVERHARLLAPEGDG